MIYDIIINGVATSGKDTFVELFTDIRPGVHVTNISSIDPFRNMPSRFGWDGKEKTDNYRMCLKLLKEASVYMDDYPTRYLLFKREETLKKFEGLAEDFVFFYHIREPQEIKKFKKKLKGIRSLLIKRKMKRVPRSEKGILRYKYDYTIHNNGSLADLKESAYKYLMKLKGVRV